MQPNSTTKFRKLEIGAPASSGIALVIAPLMLGGLLYLGFRGDELLMFRVLEKLGLKSEVNLLREFLQPVGSSLPTWVVYSLPHALWTFSMLAFFAHVWHTQPSQRRIWTTGAGLGSAGSELLQAAGVVPGTFSLQDLLGVACACLAYIIIAVWLRGPSRSPSGTLTFSFAALYQE
jgi:hypothetical protein